MRIDKRILNAFCVCLLLVLVLFLGLLLTPRTVTMDDAKLFADEVVKMHTWVDSGINYNRSPVSMSGREHALRNSKTYKDLPNQYFNISSYAKDAVINQYETATEDYDSRLVKKGDDFFIKIKDLDFTAGGIDYIAIGGKVVKLYEDYFENAFAHTSNRSRYVMTCVEIEANENERGTYYDVKYNSVADPWGMAVRIYYDEKGINYYTLVY